MEKQGIIMFYELCRLCLENAGTVDMFGTDDLVSDVYTFTAIKVSIKDNLPNKICTNCCNTIQSVKNLKIIANKNDSHLRSLFGDDLEGEDSEGSIDIIINVSSSSQTNEAIPSVFFAKDDGTYIKKNQSPEDCEIHPKTTKIETISVRKDIFESSSAVSSSTSKTPSEDNITHQVLRAQKKNARSITAEKDLNDLECKVCHKTFDTPKKLYLHQRLHFKNILCPLDACGKKFATKGDLEKHIRTHTGERPYKCEICERSFTQRGSLKSHRDAVHGVNGYILSQ